MGIRFLRAPGMTSSKGRNLHPHQLLSQGLTVVTLSVLNFGISGQIAGIVSYCKGAGPTSERLQLTV